MLMAALRMMSVMGGCVMGWRVGDGYVLVSVIDLFRHIYPYFDLFILLLTYICTYLDDI